MKLVQPIRGNDDRPHALGTHSVEVRVHHIARRRARRLDDDKAFGSNGAGNPRSDAIARDVPGMWKGVGIAHPARGREHGYLRVRDGGANLGKVLHERAASQTRGDKVRVLIHRQHRHPMRRVIGKAEITVHPPNSVGEGTAARYDQQTRMGRSIPNDRKDSVKLHRMGKQTSTELDDDVDRAGFGLWALGSGRFLSFRHERPPESRARIPTLSAQSLMPRAQGLEPRAIPDPPPCA